MLGLAVTHPHHVDLALQAEHLAGHGQRRTPLTRSSLGDQMRGAFQLVVVGLRHGGVQLVRTGGADAFVLVKDLGWRIQRLFQAACAEERRGAPLRVGLPHRAGDLDLPLGADLLQDQAHGKQRR